MTLTTQNMIQLITGALGSVSFGILFHIKNKYLPLAAIGWFFKLACFPFCQRNLGKCVSPLFAGRFYC